MTTTIPLEDPSLLGPLDQNLELIQDELNVTITVANQSVTIDAYDDGRVHRAVRVFQELKKAQENQQIIGPELIKHLLYDANEGALGYKENAAIRFPSGYGTVYPRNMRQADFLNAMNKSDLVFGVGPAGTGKTFLAVAWAVLQLLSKKKRKLLLTRPVVEAGENLGFLPGDLSQKLQPYVRPLYDALESFLSMELLQKLEAQKTIEIAPLAYMRGRSLRDSIILLDEAQNTSTEQMKMFLTRIGENSQAIVCGDDSQVDLPRNQRSGLREALAVLDSLEKVKIVRFYNNDVIRSPLVRSIIAAYERHQKDDNRG